MRVSVRPLKGVISTKIQIMISKATGESVHFQPRSCNTHSASPRNKIGASQTAYDDMMLPYGLRLDLGRTPASVSTSGLEFRNHLVMASACSVDSRKESLPNKGPSLSNHLEDARLHAKETHSQLEGLWKATYACRRYCFLTPMSNPTTCWKYCNRSLDRMPKQLSLHLAVQSPGPSSLPLGPTDLASAAA